MDWKDKDLRTAHKTLQQALDEVKRKHEALTRVKEWLTAYDPHACINDLVDRALKPNKEHRILTDWETR
jgi:hypothetical protein